MNTKELMPCPFCGAAAELKHLGEHFGASCTDWKCQGMQGALMHRDEQKAIGAWNRRAALPSDAAQAPWVSVADRLPASGRTVLATYLNSAGKSRRIRAQYVAAKSRESNGDDGDLECEYDEEADACYWPAGWYECINNWSDYTHVFVNEGEITHWTDMPAAPGEPDAAPVAPAATALITTEQRKALADAERVLGENWEHETADRLHDAFAASAAAAPIPAEQQADWRGDFERKAAVGGFDLSCEEWGGDYCHDATGGAWLWYYSGRLDQACAGPAKSSDHIADARKLVAQPDGRAAFTSALILAICELPDRTSPEDEPGAMVANADEIASCVERACESAGLRIVPDARDTVRKAEIERIDRAGGKAC